MPIAAARTETLGTHERARVPLPLRLAKRARRAVAALAVLASLALLAPSIAAAQSVNVTNLGQTADTGLTLSTQTNYQGFTTGGTSTARYTLNSVEVRISSCGTATPVLAIHASAANGRPSTQVGSNLTRSGTTDTFNASGITLKGGTKYFVKFTKTGSGSCTFGDTRSNGEDSSSTSGWSIENVRYVNTTTTDGQFKLRFKVNATTAAAGATCPTTGLRVCNLTQTSHATGESAGTGGARLVNAFTTGGVAADRFTLNSVTIDYNTCTSSQRANTTVRIYNASGSNPGTQVGSNLTRSGATNTYNASSITLNGATTYFVDFANSSSSCTFNATASNAQTGSTGWSIADAGRARDAPATAWYALPSGNSLQFSVNATAQTVGTKPAAPTKTAALWRLAYGSSEHLTKPTGTQTYWLEPASAGLPQTGLHGAVNSNQADAGACARGATLEFGWYRSTALTTRLGSTRSDRRADAQSYHYLWVDNADGARDVFRALAYCQSACTYSDAVNLMGTGGGVTLSATTLALRPSNVRTTTATLTIANRSTAWWYKYTKPTSPAGTCTSVNAGTTQVSLTGLTAGTDYTYKAYSASGCADANELTTTTTHAVFQTAAPVLMVNTITRTAVTLNIANHTGAWWYKGEQSGASCVSAGSGREATVTGLSADTEYTYKAYSASGCAGANALADLTFRTAGGTGGGGDEAQAAEVSLGVSPATVTEGLPVTVTATLSQAVGEDVSIPLTLAAGATNPAEPADHGPLASIAIAAGETSGSGSIATFQDLDGDDETFTVALDTATLPASVTAGGTASVSVTIDDTVTGDTVPVVLWPNPPAILEAAAGDRQVTLRWSSVGDATGWEVQQGSGGTWTDTGGAGRSYTVTGLNNGTAYSFRVRATKLGLLKGNASASASATPSASTQEAQQTVTPAFVDCDSGAAAGAALDLRHVGGTRAGHVCYGPRGAGLDFALGGFRGGGSDPHRSRDAALFTFGAEEAHTAGSLEVYRRRIDFKAAPAATGADGDDQDWFDAKVEAGSERAVVLVRVHRASPPAFVDCATGAALGNALDLHHTGGTQAGHVCYGPHGAQIDFALGGFGGDGSAVYRSRDAALFAAGAEEAHTAGSVRVYRRSIAFRTAPGALGADGDSQDWFEAKVEGAGSNRDVVLLKVHRASVLSVADASVAEPGAGQTATLDFAVTLGRAGPGTVTVAYATADGTATAGSDYTAASGTLSFAAGETSKTVSVPVLAGRARRRRRDADAHPVQRLGGVDRRCGGHGHDHQRRPAPDGVAGALRPRTAAADAVAAVTARLETPRAAGSHLTVGGQRLDLAGPDGGVALEQALAGIARLLGAPGGSGPEADAAGWPDPSAVFDGPAAAAAASPVRTMRTRELLAGTSFRAVLGDGRGLAVDRLGPGGVGVGVLGRGSGARLERRDGDRVDGHGL